MQTYNLLVWVPLALFGKYFLFFLLILLIHSSFHQLGKGSVDWYECRYQKDHETFFSTCSCQAHLS
jgi:hypothetical protein